MRRVHPGRVTAVERQRQAVPTGGRGPGRVERPDRVLGVEQEAHPATVDATHDELVAAGSRSHLAPWDAFWGQRYATVLDPDGNAVDLFAALAG